MYGTHTEYQPTRPKQDTPCPLLIAPQCIHMLCELYIYLYILSTYWILNIKDFLLTTYNAHSNMNIISIVVSKWIADSATPGEATCFSPGRLTRLRGLGCWRCGQPLQWRIPPCERAEWQALAARSDSVTNSWGVTMGWSSSCYHRNISDFSSPQRPKGIWNWEKSPDTFWPPRVMIKLVFETRYTPESLISNKDIL